MTLPTLVTTPERLHVLQIVDADGDGASGVERTLLQLVKRLPRERFRTSAVLPHECRFADQLRHCGADVTVMAMAADPPWASIQGVAALVRHAAVDVLHAHRPHAHALASLAGHLTARPVLATIHAHQLAAIDAEAQRSVATHLAVVCRHTYYHALAAGIEARALSLIPPGVDGGAGGRGERAGPLRRQLGLDAAAPLVGWLDAAEAGTASDAFARLAQALHRLAPAARLVRLGEPPLRAALPAPLREIDVVVAAAPPPAEALPLALLEAMAAGVPVVALRAGGAADLVDHGHTGWLVNAGDGESLARHAAELLHDDAARRRMGENARERALERFDLDVCVQRTGDLLVRLSTKAARQQAAAAAPAAPERRPSAARAG
jgi:hypothetical protein